MIVRFLTSLRWLQTWLQMRLHCHMTTAYSSGYTEPPQTKILATPLNTRSAHHVNNLKRNHIRGRLVSLQSRVNVQLGGGPAASMFRVINQPDGGATFRRKQQLAVCEASKIVQNSYGFKKMF